MWGGGDPIRAEVGVHYRSVDGGVAWTQLVFPESDLWLAQPVWVGSVLFAWGIYPSETVKPTLTHTLAVSINGSPLEWADAKLPFDPNSIAGIYGLGQTIYVIGRSNCRTSEPCTIAQSSDSGSTWTTFQPAEKAGAKFQVADDGQALMLLDNPYEPTERLEVSADAGRTWTALPTLPLLTTGYNWDFSTIFGAPSGAFILISPKAEYTLAKGAKSWTMTSMTLGYSCDAVSWDAGQAAACWGPKIVPGNSFPVGLAYHGL